MDFLYVKNGWPSFSSLADFYFWSLATFHKSVLDWESGVCYGMSSSMTKPTKWPVHSDQPGHRPSLIRVFAVRMKKHWALNYLLNAQWRLFRLGACPGWSESLPWAHSHLLVLSCGGSYHSIHQTLNPAATHITWMTTMTCYRCLDLCVNVKDRLHREVIERGIQHQPYITCRYVNLQLTLVDLNLAQVTWGNQFCLLMVSRLYQGFPIFPPAKDYLCSKWVR